MPDETPDPGLNAFARALAAAAPHPGRLDRDALLVAAGRAAQARRDRVWRYSAVALAFLSAGLSAAHGLRPPAVVEVPRYVYLTAPPAPRPPEPPPAALPEPRQLPAPVSVAADGSEGLRLRERVLRDGVTALPSDSAAWHVPPRPLSARDVPELSAWPRLSGSAPSGDESR